MEKPAVKKFQLLVKDLNIRTLVTGDKQARVVLETLDPNDIEALSKLATQMEVLVTFEYA